mmetsp:Transcript_43866/g.72646  ORF Transcript_43866/g.72646 Transcript_43866/m.72646 type:complete len:222 (-) Transcript_43866:888-1553(-)
MPPPPPRRVRPVPDMDAGSGGGSGARSSESCRGAAARRGPSSSSFCVKPRCFGLPFPLGDSEPAAPLWLILRSRLAVLLSLRMGDLPRREFRAFLSRCCRRISTLVIITKEFTPEKALLTSSFETSTWGTRVFLRATPTMSNQRELLRSPRPILSLGSFFSSPSKTSFTSSLGCLSAGTSWGAAAIAANSSGGVSALKGSLPKSMTHRTTPMLHMSAAYPE